MYPKDYKTGDEDDTYPDTRGSSQPQETERLEQDRQEQVERIEQSNKPWLPKKEIPFHLRTPKAYRKYNGK